MEVGATCRPFRQWAEEVQRCSTPTKRHPVLKYKMVGGWVRRHGKVVGSMHLKAGETEPFFVPVPGGLKAAASAWIGKRWSVKGSRVRCFSPYCADFHPDMSCAVVSRDGPTTQYIIPR